MDVQSLAGSGKWKQVRCETTDNPTSAISRISQNLLTIKTSINTVERPRKESRIGMLVKQLPPPGITRPPPPGIAPSERDEVREPKFPWEMDKAMDIVEEEEWAELDVKPPSLAELILPDSELKRLRALILSVQHGLKVGKFGLTDNVVQRIYEKWKTCEIVKLQFEGRAALSMIQTHQEIERRTGGLVIWRLGTFAVVYRGKDYSGPPLSFRDMEKQNSEERRSKDEAFTDEKQPAKDEEVNAEPEYNWEMDDLLSELGPRYYDWSGPKPLPVDGDKLPAFDSTYMIPFRELPDGMDLKLSDTEFTDLRRRANSLPTHFIIGRWVGHQGLAGALLKFWEKHEIAKIGIKTSVQAQNNERVAKELKKLTGGVILGRDKECIIIYRGKDFLSAEITALLEEREVDSIKSVQHDAYQIRASSLSDKNAGEMPVMNAKIADWIIGEEEQVKRDIACRVIRAGAAATFERRLPLLRKKKFKAERELEKVESFLKPKAPPVYFDLLSEEEKHMLVKLGMKMRAVLYTGRRGIFSGTIENMHLQWKHREVVKLLYEDNEEEDVHATARMIAYESGGILVGVRPVSKGYAILVYRGRNYSRPDELKPRTLLNKRNSLKRCRAKQRAKDLEQSIMSVEQEITDLKQAFERCSHSESVEEEMKEERIQMQQNHKTLQVQVELLKPTEMPKSQTEFGRVERITNQERLLLRKKALRRGIPSHFHVGKRNGLNGIIRAMNNFFKINALVKLGTKCRPWDISQQEIAKVIEEGTGAMLVSVENKKLIFYRGWADNKDEAVGGTKNVCQELVCAAAEEDAITMYELSSDDDDDDE